jgi:prepilin-type N-terminal cleavage/methylation domain-containing protein
MKRGMTWIEVLISISVVSILVSMCLMRLNQTARTSRAVKVHRWIDATNELTGDQMNIQVYQILIDGCEYLKVSGESGFIHKGNCTNSVHAR